MVYGELFLANLDRFYSYSAQLENPSLLPLEFLAFDNFYSESENLASELA